jgi:holo-[acyl-carrier protein] synthase
MSVMTRGCDLDLSALELEWAGRVTGACVFYGRARRPAATLDGWDLRDIFTLRERRYLSGTRKVQSWAGRLAAKYAVADALDVDRRRPEVLRAIEIVPHLRRPCSDPYLCRLGHPLTADIGLSRVGVEHRGVVRAVVSISHDDGVAFAAALVVHAALTASAETAFAERAG